MRKDVCVVIGNGKSLNDVPLEFLQAYSTFGANRIYLYFVPTYYVCVNPLVLEQNREEIDSLECEKFVRAGMGFSGTQLRKGLNTPFSFNPFVWVNEGYTVTYVSLQLAYKFNFETVLLVGVDHSYQMDAQPNEVVYMAGDDPNHFSADYFKGQRWQMPDLKKSERYYRIARDIYEKDNRRIINLTPDSALDVFEKGDIDEWMP